MYALVTVVQTCALPFYHLRRNGIRRSNLSLRESRDPPPHAADRPGSVRLSGRRGRGADRAARADGVRLVTGPSRSVSRERPRTDGACRFLIARSWHSVWRITLSRTGPPIVRLQIGRATGRVRGGPSA